MNEILKTTDCNYAINEIKREIEQNKIWNITLTLTEQEAYALYTTSHHIINSAATREQNGETLTREQNNFFDDLESAYTKLHNLL